MVHRELALGIIMEIIINNNAVVETGVIGSVLSTRHSLIEFCTSSGTRKEVQHHQTTDGGIVEITSDWGVAINYY